MDTSLNIAPPPHMTPQSAPLRERAMTTRVQPLERADPAATLPDNNPFIARIVTARLSGSDYPDSPAEIAPPDRTLRPYDVPMLPFDDDSENALSAHAAPPATSFIAASDQSDRAPD